VTRADPQTAADPATRIAMWSGPRTVSTALLRAWENRPDTVVTDEPLYAFYLDRTGIDHPGRDAVIASQPTDWRWCWTEERGTSDEGRRRLKGAPEASEKETQCCRSSMNVTVTSSSTSAASSRTATGGW
jgi:hypothetical protein